MTNPEVFDALQDIVRQTTESMVEAVDALPPDSASCDQDSNALFEDCEAHIANISMAAEVAEVNGLHSLCLEVSEILRKVSGESDRLAQVPTILEWMYDLQAYLAQPDDQSLAAKIVLLLPEEQRQSCLEKLLENDSNVTPDNLPTEDQAAIWAETETMDAADDGIMGLVVQEVVEIEPQLIELTQLIFGDDLKQSEAAVIQYLEILTRLRAVGNDLGLLGLRDACDFVSDNMNCAADLGPDEGKLFKNCCELWPGRVLSYLVAPTDDQVCLELINYFQNDSWPKSLSEDSVREFLEALTTLPELSETEESEQRQTIAQPEDVALEISDDVSAELIAAFFQETPNHAVNFSANMERVFNGEEVLKNVESALRLTHTIKGSASLIGADGVANLAHHLEDILEYLAKKQVRPPAALTTTLQESADCLEAMIDALRGLDTAPEDSQRILQDILDWANRIDQGVIELDATEPDDEVPQTVTDTTPLTQEINSSGEDSATRLPMPGTEMLQVPMSSIDLLFKLVGETSIAFGRIQEHLSHLIQQGQNLRSQDNIVQERRFELENLVSVRNFAGLQRQMPQVSNSPEVFDSLELDQYDELYGTSHRFIEAVADSREFSLRLQSEFSALEGLFAEQKVLNRELQQIVMAVRMVPIAKIGSRLQRSVRQVCRATGKQAELSIQGSELLLDSEVLDRLADPLMHILRNAVDHGIETREERERKGKPAIGKLTLTFARDGNHMVVRCSDDGQGLNYESIRDKAVANGLLGTGEAKDNSELARLILVSGFSTRESATQISGRGVGMDVVNIAVTDLKGHVAIDEADGSGCLITLRLPITLITSHTLIVKAAKEIYAIPTNFIEQILPETSGSFSKLGNDVTYHLDNTVYPAKKLTEILNIVPQPGRAVTDRRKNVRADKEEKSRAVLLIRTDTGLVAVLVEQVINSVDLVVKGLGRFVKSIPGISGIATLGDGRVVPVLDLPQSLREPIGTTSPVTSGLSRQPTAQELEIPSVLIVDDSLSVRKSLSEITADAGYQPLLARDGFEAVEFLRKHMPKVILADLEMPNMNGLELTSYVKTDEKLSEIPVIMITSRTQTKHRRQAEEAGVNAFFNKPYSADELLATMDKLLLSA